MNECQAIADLATDLDEAAFGLFACDALKKSFCIGIHRCGGLTAVIGRRDCRHQAVILDDGRILLVRHRHLDTGRSYWVLPGGGAEVGENGEACIVREVREETHLVVEVVSVLLEETVVDTTYDRTCTYLCRVVAGDARPGIEPEPELDGVYDIAAVAWWPINDPSAWDQSITDDAHTMSTLATVQSALGR